MTRVISRVSLQNILANAVFRWVLLLHQHLFAQQQLCAWQQPRMDEATNQCMTHRCLHCCVCWLM